MTAAPADYLPPQNPDAEQAVLGAVLMDPDNIAVLGPMVRPDDFARLENADIWRAMLDLWRKRTPAADILLIDALKTSAAFQAAGGAAYLAELRASSWLGIYGEYYAELVAKLATKRRMIALLSRYTGRAWEADTDPGDLVAALRRELSDVIGEPGKQTTRTFAELADEIQTELNNRLDESYVPDVVRTGLYDLDRVIRGGGWQPGELIVMPAMSGMGKTALAMQIVKNYARHQVATNTDPNWTMVFSAEMSGPGLMWRALTEHTHLSTGQLQDPRHLTDAQWERVIPALDELAVLPVVIDDRPSPSTEQMIEAVERMQAHRPVRFVMFDYIGLAGDTHRDETHRYSQISAGLKRLAKQCNVSVLALSQLNREVENQTNRRPTLRHIRQSGQIAADADMVIALYRHDYYVGIGLEEPNDDLHNVAELIVLKQRDGTTPVVRVQFTPETVSFHSLDRRHE